MAEEMKSGEGVQPAGAPQAPGPEKTKAQRLENIKGLEDIVDTLTEDVVKALDIKEEKKRLVGKIRQLKQQEAELKEVVGDLKTTRDKLQMELQKKAEDIGILQSKIANLKEDRAKLSSEKVTLKDQIKNLEIEKDQMSVSLDKTNDMLTKLRHQIETFDEEIKA
jgi:chromosome segregation ATPase